MQEDIPFPSLARNSLAESLVIEGSTKEHSVSSSEPTMNVSPASSQSPESHVTGSSSRLTSSDKLSALPSSPTPTPSPSRMARTSTFSSNIKRAYRRSFDGSLSLPTLPAGDNEGLASKRTNNAWSIPRDGNKRFESNPSNFHKQSTPDNGSSGKETPRQRVSFDGDRNSLPTMASVSQAISRITTRDSERRNSPPQLHSSLHLDHRDEHNANHKERINSRSPSPSRSRATSPLRILHNWSAGFHRGRTTSEERFVPIDPFKFRSRMPFCGIGSGSYSHDIETGEGSSTSSAAYDCDDLIPTTSIRAFFRDSRIFLTDTLPREIYLNLLLRLPAMYFSRVARIFEDADVSRPDIQRMIDNSGGCRTARPFPAPAHHQSSEVNSMGNATPAKSPPGALFTEGGSLSPGPLPRIGVSAQASLPPAASMIHMPLPFPDEWTPPLVSPALIRFKHSWEAFIDSLLREWKTLNLVSALLASAILTIFQIPQAADDPLTRTFALLSLMCALMSLSYGCIYIVRFGTMRNMFHASRWAEEARKMNTAIWWNVWVLLATPAVWMAWAMVLFLSAILSFVWRTGSASDPTDRSPLGDRAALGPRIAITGVLLLGMIYLAMIVKTLKRYGSQQGVAQNTGDVNANSRSGAERSPPNRNKGRATQTRDIDIEMERRGRGRERSTSTHVRRREEEPEGRRRDI